MEDGTLVFDLGESDVGKMSVDIDGHGLFFAFDWPCQCVEQVETVEGDFCCEDAAVALVSLLGQDWQQVASNQVGLCHTSLDIVSVDSVVV